MPNDNKKLQFAEDRMAAFAASEPPMSIQASLTLDDLKINTGKDVTNLHTTQKNFVYGTRGTKSPHKGPNDVHLARRK